MGLAAAKRAASRAAPPSSARGGPTSAAGGLHVLLDERLPKAEEGAAAKRMQGIAAEVE